MCLDVAGRVHGAKQNTNLPFTPLSNLNKKYLLKQLTLPYVSVTRRTTDEGTQRTITQLYLMPMNNR
jgi:hypothetical protein